MTQTTTPQTATETLAEFDYDGHYRVVVTAHPERDNRVVYTIYRASQNSKSGWVFESTSWTDTIAHARQDSFYDITEWYRSGVAQRDIEKG